MIFIKFKVTLYYYLIYVVFFCTEDDFEDLQNQFRKSSLSTTLSSLYQSRQGSHQIFTPGSSLLVFEGAETDYDLVKFQVCRGERQVYRGKGFPRTSGFYEPQLLTTSSDVADSLQAGEDEKFIEKFLSQFERINKTYDKEKHGKMVSFGRFGKIYYSRYPPKTTMNISELSNLSGPEGLNSTFVPLSLSHEKVHSFLLKEGYVDNEWSKCEYMVSVENYQTKAKLHLDGNFEVKQVTTSSKVSLAEGASESGNTDRGMSGTMKWLVFDVKRQDLAKHDIRFVFQSVQNLFPDSDSEEEEEEGEKIIEIKDPHMRHFLSSKIIKSVDSDQVYIAERFKPDVDFIRRKISKAYVKPEEEDAERPAFQATVVLIKTKEYACPRFGRFTDVTNWKEEVVIQPKIPNFKDKKEGIEFAKEFIRFCFALENAAHQP